jgi:hypothetical protein
MEKSRNQYHHKDDQWHLDTQVINEILGTANVHDPSRWVIDKSQVGLS